MLLLMFIIALTGCFGGLDNFQNDPDNFFLSEDAQMNRQHTDQPQSTRTQPAILLRTAQRLLHSPAAWWLAVCGAAVGCVLLVAPPRRLEAVDVTGKKSLPVVEDAHVRGIR